MKHTRVVSTKCTPGFACRAFSDTNLVCVIVNAHTAKCSRYDILSIGLLEQAYRRYGRGYKEVTSEHIMNKTISAMCDHHKFASVVQYGYLKCNPWMVKSNGRKQHQTVSYLKLN